MRGVSRQKKCSIWKVGRPNGVGKSADISLDAAKACIVEQREKKMKG